MLAFLIFISFLYIVILQYIKTREVTNESRDNRVLKYFGFIQLFIDFTLISVVILFNGGLGSKLIFLYYPLILIGGFVFLRTGALVFSVASSVAIGLLADLQYYFNFGYHPFFLSNPDKLLFLASINILGVLIFGSLLYHFSGGMRVLSEKMVEMDKLMKNSQNFNKELMNSFSQGVIVLDGNYNVVFINKEAVNILDLQRFNRAFINKAGVLFNFNLDIRDILNNFPINILGGVNKKHDVQYENKHNGLKRFEIKHQGMILGFSHAEFIYYKGFPGKFMLFFRDITFIKQMEIESKINEGLMTAGKFAGWLAHEVRNPLLAINTSADILNSQNLDYDSDDYKKLTGIIRTESLRLDNLVNDFLSFAKIKSTSINYNKNNYESFNLFEMVDDIILSFPEQSKDGSSDTIKINICNRLDPNRNIFSEKYRIHQVLLNILQNSVQSLRGRNIKSHAGIIRIASKIMKDGSGKEWLLVSIFDNGEGMDEFTLKNIFKPLFTTKENGIGLGLPIVYSILENLGGEIRVQSRINTGTLIKISLPI